MTEPMTEHPLYLLDQLEQADMLEIDGLHAFDFQLDDDLLDQADAAAEAGLPFASDAIALRIECQDGRERRHWQFSYNALMEALYQPESETWQLPGSSLKCLSAIGVSAEDE